MLNRSRSNLPRCAHRGPVSPKIGLMGPFQDRKIRTLAVDIHASMHVYETGGLLTQTR